MAHSSIRVQKFGGAGLSSIEKVKCVASHLNQLHKAGHKVIAVVSAMGNTTNELIDKAYEISSHPDKRELDMLISTGERVSMALLTMALKDLGCEALSLTGSQAGIMTNGEHSSATITEVKPIRVAEALQEGKIVVIAGFQGVNPDSKEITTLGRGGTDTTAVALASHFHASTCEIIKEVPGICAADPKLEPSAKVFEKIGFDALKHMCKWGTKALHLPCVQLADELKIPIWVGPLSETTSEMPQGTICGTDADTVAISTLDSIIGVNYSGESRLPEQDLMREFSNRNWKAPTFLAKLSAEPFQLIFQVDDQTVPIFKQLLNEAGSGYEIAFERRKALSLTAPDQILSEFVKMVAEIPAEAVIKERGGLSVILSDQDFAEALTKSKTLLY